MKAPPFAYVQARSLGEVFDLLEHHGESARLLAGGQSLLASLNMRLAAPKLLIDITHIAGLSGIEVRGRKIRIGALTTHAQIQRSAEIARHLPLLSQAAPHIAHVAIRNVGTFGGSLAHADPAAEWPACCVVLDAQFVLRSRAGTRRVAAREFFQGLYATALRPNEILTQVEVAATGANWRSAFVELSRRRGDYATVGVAALARKSARGVLSDLRVAFLGVGPAPALARASMAALEGKRVSADTIAAAGEALGQDLEPSADLHAAASTKLHLARVITGRALTTLAA